MLGYVGSGGYVGICVDMWDMWVYEGKTNGSLYGSPGLYVALSGSLWLSLALYGSLWLSLALYGSPGLYVALSGSLSLGDAR